MIYIFLLIFLLFLLIEIYFLYKYLKKKRVLNKTNFILKKNKILKNSFSNKEKLIDLDKLYHNILKELWYSWTFWEILKLEPKEISNINKIWELHKLRNKLVHDFDLISDSLLKKKVNEYLKEIDKLLN